MAIGIQIKELADPPQLLLQNHFAPGWNFGEAQVVDSFRRLWTDSQLLLNPRFQPSVVLVVGRDLGVFEVR